ncbi:MAG TPA: MFS transporter [Stellaceae bacterium]|jgi:putative MFS transporter|nr:MFS transporter [Stellaceae bacterium]
MAQSARQSAASQTIERFVGEQMDNAAMGTIHWRVLALVASGYFIDVIDYTILGALIPDLVGSKFMSPEQAGLIGTATLAGLFIGALGQGEFTDRFGRKAVYQFNLLLFGLATIAGAWAPSYGWLVVARFLAGIGLGAEQPLCFSYTAEYAPKLIRGRIIALMQFIGGAWPWPLGVLFVLGFRDTLGWRGIWTVIGILALVIFVLRFSLPESPRWLATHGQGQRALDLLQRMGLRTVPLDTLRTDAASDTKSDPFGIIFRAFPKRVIAGMVCFVAFFGVALGLGNWLPSMMANMHGFTISKSLVYTAGINLAFPLASAFMMYALEKFGRKTTSVAAFILAGLSAVAVSLAQSAAMFAALGFVMVFFIQLAGNSSQIFIAEVFPTNARASGFGLAQSAGRIASAFIIPGILILQNAYGLSAVFVAIAIALVIAAFAVTQVGPEARGVALDEVAQPTG